MTSENSNRLLHPSNQVFISDQQGEPVNKPEIQQNIVCQIRLYKPVFMLTESGLILAALVTFASGISGLILAIRGFDLLVGRFDLWWLMVNTFFVLVALFLLFLCYQALYNFYLIVRYFSGKDAVTRTYNLLMSKGVITKGEVTKVTSNGESAIHYKFKVKQTELEKTYYTDNIHDIQSGEMVTVFYVHDIAVLL